MSRSEQIPRKRSTYEIPMIKNTEFPAVSSSKATETALSSEKEDINDNIASHHSPPIKANHLFRPSNTTSPSFRRGVPIPSDLHPTTNSASIVFDHDDSYSPQQRQHNNVHQKHRLRNAESWMIQQQEQ